MLCSCGTDRPHQIARRLTADGIAVALWSDGALSSGMGRQLPGVPMRRPRTPKARELALCAGRLLLGEVELWDLAELGDLYAAAERAARGDGLPGTLRALMAEFECPRLELRWTVVAADPKGRPTERRARLPRLRWPRTMVVDYCGGPGSARGRYCLMNIVQAPATATLRSGDVLADTGLAFDSQRDLFAFLFSESGQVRRD